VLGTIEINSKL